MGSDRVGRAGRTQVAGQDLLDPVAQDLPGFVTGKLDPDPLGFVPLGARRRDPGDGARHRVLGRVVHQHEYHGRGVAQG